MGFGVPVESLEQFERVYGPRQDDWYCLRCEEWCCEGCGTTFHHVMEGGDHGEHLVIVWPARDDPTMYSMIGSLGGKAAIVPFEDSIGPPVSFYAIRPS